MNKIAIILTAGTLLAPLSSAFGQAGQHSFSVNAARIGGGAGGEVVLTGGGAFDLQSGFVRAGGEFRCTQDINGGPLAGIRAGEGIRWTATEVVASSGFKCGGVAGEPLKTAVTDNDTVVFRAAFIRQGNESNPLTALVFVSEADENPDLPGVQNIWIQSVGCGEAITQVR